VTKECGTSREEEKVGTNRTGAVDTDPGSRLEMIEKSVDRSSIRDEGSGRAVVVIVVVGDHGGLLHTGSAVQCCAVLGWARQG